MNIRMGWFVLVLLMLVGCRTRHEIDMTHEVKPIHITLDVNLKIERELDDFFADLDEADAAQVAEQAGK